MINAFFILFISKVGNASQTASKGQNAVTSNLKKPHDIRL